MANPRYAQLAVNSAADPCACVAPAAAAVAAGAAAAGAGAGIGSSPLLGTLRINPTPPLSAGAQSVDDRRTVTKSGNKSVARNGYSPTAPKPVDEDSEALRKRYRLLNHAARLVPELRVANCMRAPISLDDRVQVRKRADVDGASRHSFCGLQACGSVWVCPFCAPYIASQREQEYNRLLSWAADEGLHCFALTLTHSHHDRLSLQDNLDGLFGVPDKSGTKRGGAISRFLNCKYWRRLKPNIKGWARVCETTHGTNGWHVHSHWILVVDLVGMADAASKYGISYSITQADLARSWQRACVAAGLPSPSLGRGVKLEMIGADGTAPPEGWGGYMSKKGDWNIQKEMAKGHMKKGRASSRSVQQLLCDSMAGDREAGELFREYALGTKGLRQSMWSRGLKSACGIPDLADQDIADERAPVESVEFVMPDLIYDRLPGELSEDRIIYADHKQLWRLVLGRGSRVDLLDAVREGGQLGGNAYLKRLLDEYNDGYEPFDDDAPSRRPLPYFAPVAIRPDG